MRSSHPQVYRVGYSSSSSSSAAAGGTTDTTIGASTSHHQSPAVPPPVVFSIRHSGPSAPYQVQQRGDQVRGATQVQYSVGGPNSVSTPRGTYQVVAAPLSGQQLSSAAVGSSAHVMFRPKSDRQRVVTLAPPSHRSNFGGSSDLIPSSNSTIGRHSTPRYLTPRRQQQYGDSAAGSAAPPPSNPPWSTRSTHASQQQGATTTTTTTTLYHAHNNNPHHYQNQQHHLHSTQTGTHTYQVPQTLHQVPQTVHQVHPQYVNATRVVKGPAQNPGAQGVMSGGGMPSHQHSTGVDSRFGRGVLGKFFDSMRATFGVSHRSTPRDNRSTPRDNRSTATVYLRPSNSQTTRYETPRDTIAAAGGTPRDTPRETPRSTPREIPTASSVGPGPVASGPISSVSSSQARKSVISPPPSSTEGRLTIGSQTGGEISTPVSTRPTNTNGGATTPASKPVGGVRMPRLDLSAIKLAQQQQQQHSSHGTVQNIHSTSVTTKATTAATTTTTKTQSHIDGRGSIHQPQTSSTQSESIQIPQSTGVTTGASSAAISAATSAATSGTASGTSATDSQIGVRRPIRQVRFSWTVSRALIKLVLQPAETFRLEGVAWPNWHLRKIPTLGASPTSCRVQEMYKATIPSARNGGEPLRVFVKSVPVAVWRRQWEAQNQWEGEYVTDGENFVMEAAALAFLEQYGRDLAPRLLGILELSNGPVSGSSSQGTSTTTTNNMSTNTTALNHVSLNHTSHGNSSGKREVTHIIIVSELYGEDLLDYLERRDKLNRPVTTEEKRDLQFRCLLLLRRLHSLGLSHLDFTPENLLWSPTRGLRLCDFAKATPLRTFSLRHTPGNGEGRAHPFESCEPTVGKGAFMPPECWKVYWRLEESRIQYPLEELWALGRPEDRAAYYFRVDAADVYMAGVLLFWLWSDGGMWKCSDERQDDKYGHLIASSLDFDLFKECRQWPAELKQLLRGALQPEPRRRATLAGMIQHSWFKDLREAANIVK